MSEDYPRTLMELEERFSSEEACLEYLAQRRWPNGFSCSGCGCREAWRAVRGLWVCRNCLRQTTVTAGTIFADSHLSLRLWFRAIWQVVTQKDGASAMGLQRVLGLGSYRTAWSLLHKLRRAMVRPGRERLRGSVEVDECYFGAPERGKNGRQSGRKTLVIAAVECVGERKIGRIRLRKIQAASAIELEAFIGEAIEPGAMVCTDDWSGYRGLRAKGSYHHHPTSMRLSAANGEMALPRVHLVFSLLQRWLMSTHQGAVRQSHLDYYLDEFTFRFNRRTSASRGKLFYRLIEQALGIDPVPYRSLRAGNPPKHN
ncbi:MAG: IS1595 family transposase [Chthoniobacteraceae bacterium]